MNKTQRLENAKRLAREIVRVEKKIQSIIDTNQSKFDVLHDEEKGWIVQTSYCQMGGCVAGFVTATSEKSAKRIATEMTFKGITPNYNGLCDSCRYDLIQKSL